jgi:hypothetical protein
MTKYYCCILTLRMGIGDEDESFYSYYTYLIFFK